jgi:hypothetical protein
MKTSFATTIGAVLTGLLFILDPSIAAADTKKELLELTGGRRVKIAWNQGPEADKICHYLDTKDGVIHKLDFGGTAPLWTKDGRLIIVAVGNAKERKIVAYDTEAKKLTELVPPGPANHVLAVWTDPKTKRTWVYVNSSGDNNEAWNQAKGGAIQRFAIDKPTERELFWDRTSTHIYLMFSGDGTRACFEPSWANIGQLKLAFTDDGKVDQDKSEYKSYGGGCFPSIAPDNSYRLFRLDGDHTKITMSDADNGNPRKVDVMGAMFGAKGNTWLTRWSTDPDFISLVADNRICLGRLDKDATKFEKWVAVSEKDAGRAWQSQAWVEPKK